jgi:hypothetical protein
MSYINIVQRNLEKILSHNLPKEWKKNSYMLSNLKADHFNLKSSDFIVAFVAE